MILPLVPTTLDYLVTVDTSNLLGNLAYVNTRRTRFRKQPLRPTATGWEYLVTTLEFEQTETKGLAQLDADTAGLRDELRIETDTTGTLHRITNKEELRRKWTELEPRLTKKYRHSPDITPGMVQGLGQVLHGEGYLEGILCRGYEYGILFPGLYGTAYDEQPVPGAPRTIARFLGDFDLPLLTTVRRQPTVPADVQLGLVVTGHVDPAHYPAAGVRDALRELTDQYDLDTRLNLQHLESYEFDRNQELRYGAQFTIYGVPGVLLSKTSCTLAVAPA